MKLEFITPESILFSGEITEVILPGKEGVFGVLPGHAPVVAALKAGVVTIGTQEGEVKRLVILSGLAEVTPEKATVLAETAEDCSGVSVAEAQTKLAEAQKALDEAIKEEDKKQAQQGVLIAETLVEGLKAA